MVRFAEVVRRLRGHEVLNDRVVHLARDAASLVGVAQLPQCAVAGVVDPVQQRAADHDRDGQGHSEQERRVAQLVQWRHHRRLREPNGDDPRARQVLVGQDEPAVRGVDGRHAVLAAQRRVEPAAVRRIDSAELLAEARCRCNTVLVRHGDPEPGLLCELHNERLQLMQRHGGREIPGAAGRRRSRNRCDHVGEQSRARGRRRVRRGQVGLSGPQGATEVVLLALVDPDELAAPGRRDDVAGWVEHGHRGDGEHVQPEAAQQRGQLTASGRAGSDKVDQVGPGGVVLEVGAQCLDVRRHVGRGDGRRVGDPRVELAAHCPLGRGLVVSREHGKRDERRRDHESAASPDARCDPAQTRCVHGLVSGAGYRVRWPLRRDESAHASVALAPGVRVTLVSRLPMGRLRAEPRRCCAMLSLPRRPR